MAAVHKKASRGVELVIPIDTSEIEDRGEFKELKALLVDSSGETQSRKIKLGDDGKSQVVFKLARPRAARVIVGPPEASDEELEGLQTLAVDVPLQAWADTRKLKLSPIIVQPWYWYWWLRWCRTFTIRGRLLCPDGNPVPGAEVCAYDVDRFWWWCSDQRVGCATTDATGAFTITFRWCCGWWPSWWWRHRLWRIDPDIARTIIDTVQRVPEILPLPQPYPVPELGVLKRITTGDQPETGPSVRLDDPSLLDALRPELLAVLPQAPQLQALRIWPWAPWHPWWDCTPDIIFKATQDCGQGEVIVLDENCSDVRWNIPTTLDVTLVASNEACCARRRDPRCDGDECVVLSHICNDLVTTVGGNVGAVAAPAGYRNPGAMAIWGDRPYSGTIPIWGVCADWIDYYAFDYSGDSGATWNPLPPNSTGGFTLSYFDPGGPPWFIPVTFKFAMVDGKWVIETLGRWEAVNGPRIWVGNITTLIRWHTTTASSPTGPTALFPDGTYHLRLRSYSEASGNLTDLGIPPLCGTQADNGVVVTIDNRMVGPGAGHPTAPDHPVGGVHLATTEPDTDFIEIRVNGVKVKPCDIIDPEGTMEIDFLAHDPDGHLSQYTLFSLWGENSSRNLLNPALVPSGTLTRIPFTGTDQVGPTYGAARLGSGAENLPAAAAPTWNGGRMRLTITNIRDGFPVPCAYLLDLRAYKRTIVNCDEDYDQRNRSTMTFTVT